MRVYFRWVGKKQNWSFMDHGDALVWFDTAGRDGLVFRLIDVQIQPDELHLFYEWKPNTVLEWKIAKE